MLKFKNIIVILILILSSVSVHAQVDRNTIAATLLQAGKLDSAKMVIDLAVADTEYVNDGETWYLRGFIYKSLYIKNEKNNKQSPSRLEALSSFKRSLLIDTASENILKNSENIKLLCKMLFNDVARGLDSINYKISIDNFDKFKKYWMIIDTSQANFKKWDIEFLNALASVYTQIDESNKTGKSEYLTLAKNAYTKVLSLDPNNYQANYDIGILYFNQAINLIKQSDYGIDIVALNDIQDGSIKLFKEALPLMIKADEIEPNRRETLLGLSAIYFSLNDQEKSELYKKKLKDIENKK